MRSQLTNSHKLTRGGDCPLQQAGEAVRGALPFLDSRFLRCCHFIKAGLKTVLIDGVNLSELNPETTAAWVSYTIYKATDAEI
jgi:hypothetical protein